MASRYPTTARDISKLAIALHRDFPQYYPYFATPSFTYRGRAYYTHDNLLWRFQGTDGIKTGYTNASGFNLVSSVVRDGAHVIAVVMGGNTARQRDDEMVRLLASTFGRVRANPELVVHGAIPWRSVPAADLLPPPPQLVPIGPPAPVISLAAPTLSPFLAKSGEIDEDTAESYASDNARENPDCVQRTPNRRV